MSEVHPGCGASRRPARSLRLVLLCGALLFLSAARPGYAARSPDPHDNFLAIAAPLARASQRETGVPASVTLAQAILETAWGEKPIGAANNYFGIKARLTAFGDIEYGRVAVGWVWAETKEWDGTRYVDVRAPFRRYLAMADSFRDHGYLLRDTPRYAGAMAHLDDPDEFARQVAQAGYATSPTYASLLLQLMRTYDLYRFDLPRDDAEIVERTYSLIAEPGRPFDVSLTLKNAGFGVWRAEEGYVLVSTAESPLGASPRQELAAEVLPESSLHLAIHMTAPGIPGEYETHWRLKHGARVFGPEMGISITVRAPSAAVQTPWLLLAFLLLLFMLPLAVSLSSHFAARRAARQTG